MAISLRRHDHFGQDPPQESHEALSSASVGNAFVDRVYSYLSPTYDIAFGLPLQPGRVKAVQRLAIRPGDRVLEVGAGTGLNASLYPRNCDVTAIDLSTAMLKKARARIRRERLTNIRLLEADAAHLAFADESFDRVYAPYTVSVVSDPVRVVREMCRVCRRGGRIVVLNHFRSANRRLARIEQAISPATVHVGFKADLDMQALMDQTGLRPISVENVNFPPIWSLLTCIKR